MLRAVCNKKMGDCNLAGEMPIFFDCINSMSKYV